MLVLQSTLFLWFTLSVHVSVLMSVLCACVTWLDMFIHVVMSLTDAGGDRHMLPSIGSCLSGEWWLWSCMDRLCCYFPPHSPYLTQDLLFVCVCTKIAQQSLCSFLSSDPYLGFFFGLNTAFQEGFCCISTAVVEAEALEEAFKSRRCGVNKYSWVSTRSIQCCSFWSQR